MNIDFDENAVESEEIRKAVRDFLANVECIERQREIPILIHQDGVKSSYYIRCCMSGEAISRLVSLDARLDPSGTDTFRDNRDLMLRHNTFQRMSRDAENQREFNDIIVEYNTSYLPERPLKVWGGQHRSRAIQDAYAKRKVARNHGFRVYFCLSKEQRSELALVSNTNIAVSNDLFDRQLEETLVGPYLREWCVKVGLLSQDEDFPDVGSRSEKVTTQGARTFIVNFYMGRDKGRQSSPDKIDYSVYEPHLCTSGVVLDAEYQRLIEKEKRGIWVDAELEQAGKAFGRLHHAQCEVVKQSGHNRRNFRTKALTPAIISSWSYVAGLLQPNPDRLSNHLSVPPVPRGASDPLNCLEMSKFKHDQDPVTYRGLGTRSDVKERQRLAQVFLARSLVQNTPMDRALLNRAVSTAVGLKAMTKGYIT
ncbi:MAG: hypothetical protein V1737_00130 [Chloroflexota bacterium]